MTLAKVKKQDGMTLAKVKEQDGMTLAKVRHAQVSHDHPADFNPNVEPGFQ